MKIKFDWMIPYKFGDRKLYFLSQTSNKVYSFEFSLNHIKWILFGEGIKWIGIPKVWR